MLHAGNKTEWPRGDGMNATEALLVDEQTAWKSFVVSSPEQNPKPKMMKMQEIHEHRIFNFSQTTTAS